MSEINKSNKMTTAKHKEIVTSMLKLEPKTNLEMMSFLAFTQYFISHMNDLSSCTRPLRQGIRVDSPHSSFIWDSDLVKAFEDTRQLVADIMTSLIPENKKRSPDSLKNLTKLTILNHLNQSTNMSSLNHEDLPKTLIDFLKEPQ